MAIMINKQKNTVNKDLDTDQAQDVQAQTTYNLERGASEHADLVETKRQSLEDIVRGRKVSKPVNRDVQTDSPTDTQTYLSRHGRQRSRRTSSGVESTPTQADQTLSTKKWVFKDVGHYANWRIMYPLLGQKDKQGELSWNEFCATMAAEPLFFEASNQAGASWTFTRAAMGSREKLSVVLHKPHSLKPSLQRHMVWQNRARFCHTFDWIAEDFELCVDGKVA